MARAYPRIDSARKLPEPKGKTGPRCCVCGQPARFRVLVEVNIFRGDDVGPHKVCAVNAHSASDLLALP